MMIEIEEIEEIKANIKNRFIGQRIFYYEELDSTNLEAMRLITSSQAKFGDVIVARKQSSGKGQYDRTWNSPEGGMYISIISASKVCELSNLVTFVSGIACIDAIKEVTNIQAGLKWVNDIIADNQKLGGILTETTTRGNISTHISGIGINVNSKISIEQDIKFKPVSLAQLTNNDVNINMLIARLCDSFNEHFNIYQANPRLILEKWNKYSQISGKKVEFSWENKALSGIAEGIDNLGHLIVNVNGKKYTLTQSLMPY